jgi:ribosomal 30S subunit maturation factor RimM
MKTKNLMLTTALAALLAAPVAAQESDGSGSAQQGELGSYSVGEFLDLAVVTQDGSDAGQVEAVIEGESGSQVLVALDDKTIALPLDAFSLSEDGSQLTIDRNMDELQEMAAYEPAGEMELGEDQQMADATQSGSGQGSDMQQSGDTEEMAETEELDTTVVEGTDEDVTVVTTDPSAVETDGEDTEMAEGETQMTGEQSDTEMAEGETQMTGEQSDTEMAEGETAMEGGETEMAEGEQEVLGADSETEMAEGEGTMTGGQAGMEQYAEMTVGDILGMQVIGANGNDVGEIDYVYQNANGYMAVIGIGGFLGLGEHTVALPLGDFTMNGDGQLVLDGRTEEELEAMQEIDESELEGLPNDHVISG